MQKSMDTLYNQSIKVDTEDFEKLSRQFMQQMEYKLKKVKRPSNGLKWYIAMLDYYTVLRIYCRILHTRITEMEKSSHIDV